MPAVPDNRQLLLTAQNASRHFREPSSSANKTQSIHRWTNWIAGFSGEFARNAIQQYIPFPRSDSIVLDPFAGVGTTLVEAYREGVNSLGFEINPFAALVCKVKLASPSVDVDVLVSEAVKYERFMRSFESNNGNIASIPGDITANWPKSAPPRGFKSRIPFFSPKVEKKVLHTLDFLTDLPSPVQEVFRVALASVIVGFSNYSYEPSLGSRPAAGKDLVVDAQVGEIVSKKVCQMAEDIQCLQMELSGRPYQPEPHVYCTSFFEAEQYVGPGTIDLVVTSPPYMNNYHYVRNTRPQLFWTELIATSRDLKQLEESNFGKFWQTVRGRGPVPLDFDLPLLEGQIQEIRQLNPDRGVYGGSGWANYIASYMNDVHRFCALLAKFLRPEGTAVIVVGNSVVQGKEIAVEEYFSEIAALQNLSTVDIVKVRDRVGSSIVNTGARLSGRGKPGLYDAVVILQRSR